MRRRFVRSEILSNLNDWSDVFVDLKRTILASSAFQLVGSKSVVEIDTSTSKASVLIEVVGVPKTGILTEDHNPCEILVFEFPENAFNVDFLTLKSEAEAIISGIAQRLKPVYHIVFDGNHLALHFFI